MALYRKTLIRSQFVPGKIARFGKGTELIGISRKRAYAGAEASVKEVGNRVIIDRLELAHVDAMPTDERLDLTRAAGRALVSGVEPIIKRQRLDPLNQRAAGLALVGGLAVRHPLLEELFALPIPDGQWERSGQCCHRVLLNNPHRKL